MIAVDKKKPLIPGSGGISNNVRENARTRIYRKAARSAAKLARNLASAVLLLIFFFPFYWMIITSFKSLGETMVFPPSLLPKQFHFSNYAGAFSAFPFIRFLVNSCIVTAAVLALQMMTVIPAAYAFSQYQFKGKGFLFGQIGRASCRERV